MTTFDGVGGRLPDSGTYKMAALCDERSPHWFKVVVEVSECRDDGIPAASAVFVFFREAFITINSNMEVWVSRICPQKMGREFRVQNLGAGGLWGGGFSCSLVLARSLILWVQNWRFGA